MTGWAGIEDRGSWLPSSPAGERQRADKLAQSREELPPADADAATGGRRRTPVPARQAGSSCAFFGTPKPTKCRNCERVSTGMPATGLLPGGVELPDGLGLALVARFRPLGRRGCGRRRPSTTKSVRVSTAG